MVVIILLKFLVGFFNGMTMYNHITFLIILKYSRFKPDPDYFYFFACHKVDARIVSPAYFDGAKKYYTKEQIVELVFNPKPANWPGYPPMAPMKHVPKEGVPLTIVGWITSL